MVVNREGVTSVDCARRIVGGNIWMKKGKSDCVCWKMRIVGKRKLEAQGI